MNTQHYPAGTRVVFVRHIPMEDGGTFLGKTATVTGVLRSGESALLCGRTVRANQTLNVIELDCDPGQETVSHPDWIRPIDEDPDAERITEQQSEGHPA